MMGKEQLHCLKLMKKILQKIAAIREEFNCDKRLLSLL